MEISEVRVKLTGNQSDRVRAFCSVTFDREFVVRDIKVIEGTSGLFVAMPSRKIADHCPKCKAKNHLRARYCNECGNKLREGRAPRDGSGRSKLHADIAHPINMACRERLQKAILEAYEAELEQAKQEGYQAPDLEASSDRFDNGAEYAALIAELRSERPGKAGRSESVAAPATAAEPAAEQEAEPPASEPEVEPEQAPEPVPEEAPSEAPKSEPAEADSEFGKGIF